MSDKKELISYHDWQRLLESDMTISTMCDKINQLYSEAIARYEAMLELTSQSVEDGE